MYRINDIYQKWQDRFELSIKNLEFKAGEKYAILGANGSGKSTLLRILADRIRDIGDYSKPGSAAYLPQKPYAFDLSVRENIRLGIPSGSGLSKQEQNRLIERQIIDLGLEKLADAKGHRLSGGEAQRMALARALVIQRRVLMLDEPTNALDLNGLSLAENALKNYINQSGCSLFLVSHQVSMALRICNQLIFLDQGKLEAAGLMSSLLLEPTTEKLRRFLYFEQASCQLK
jgi:tungstate transport system ATP-binding protein